MTSAGAEFEYLTGVGTRFGAVGRVVGGLVGHGGLLRAVVRHRGQFPGLEEKIAALFEDNRRHPEANWFELIGALDDEDDHLVRIGNGTEYRAARDASLYLFANDLNSKYDNNEGWLDVVIQRRS